MRLKYVTSFAYGDALPTDNSGDGEFLVYGSNGSFTRFGKSNTSSPAIIIGRKGSYGKVNWTSEPCFASDTTFFIDNSTTKNNLRWIYHVIQTLELDRNSNETAVPGLSRETAYEKYILVPTLSEQQAIANYLDRETVRIDSLINAKERQLELLEEKRRAIITNAVTRGINPNVNYKDSGIEWLGKIPEHWEMKKMKYIASLQSGDFISPEDIHEEGDYPVYGGNGLRGYTNSFLYEGDYVLIGRQGALCGNINYADGKFWASEHAVVVTLKGQQNVTWLGELLRIMNLNQYSQSAAQPGLSVDAIKNLHIPIPPYDEQNEIVSVLNFQLQKIESIKRKTAQSIELLNERRSSLISEAVTGKLEIN